MLDLLSISPPELIAIVIAVSFAAGLNVSATVVTVGLLARAGTVVLPPGVDVVSSWWVLGPAIALFVVEFVLDKVPGIDLVWNVLQTFVRVPAGALLAYGATAPLSIQHQLLAAALGAIVAFAAHSGKAALHASANLSPDPFSNALVSFGEDVAAVSLTWFATRHPYLAAAVAGAWLVAIAVLIRWVWRSLLALFQNARQGS
jgi:hypothetical protein